MAKKSTVIKDFTGFTAKEIYKPGAKPLTGSDPVLLSLIKKAAGK